MTETGLTNQLLPCPFCGHARAYVEFVCTTPNDGKRHYEVCCQICTGRGRIDTKARAIAAWNMRAPSQREKQFREVVESVGNELEFMAYTSAGQDHELMKSFALLAGKIKAALADNPNEYPEEQEK